MVLVAAAVVIVIVLMSLRGAASFYTDYLWFDELGFGSVFSRILRLKFVLAAVFTLTFLAFAWLNFWIVGKVAPKMLFGPQDEAIVRFRAAMAKAGGRLRFAIALVLALFSGIPAYAQWNNWVLFRNGVDFGIKDPQFNRDVAFYVFDLPFIGFVVDWVFGAVVAVGVFSMALHYLSGGIRLQVPGQRVSPAVKAHASLLLAVVSLIKAFDYYLQRFELNFSDRGVIRGASYTDVNASLKAIELLMLIAVAAGILFLINIFRRGWTLPILAVGIWALVAVVAAGLYPAYIQRFQVEPQESTKERPFIERNIKATRQALKLDGVAKKPFPYATDLTQTDLDANAATIRNTRLWDPAKEISGSTFERLQEVFRFYRFGDIDVDRYQLNGETSQVLVSARELNPAELPSKSWENLHLAYTHGYGMVMAPTNAATSDGEPDFILKDVPPEESKGAPKLDEPAVYFGENLGSYVVVNSGRKEVDYVDSNGSTKSVDYQGDGGVRINSVMRKTAFALRFGDLNPLISGFVKNDSKVLYVRDVRERVKLAAPFLDLDSDPYPVNHNGRVTWVVDAYTTTDRYPYAQNADTERLNGGDLDKPVNYVRNSVKATVDAYDGSVKLYVVDESDPIIRTYQKAFPKLFTSKSEIPKELQEHFRYPEDLFRIQSNMWGRYHITDAADFYNQADAWDIAQDPGSASGGSAVTQATTATGQQSTTSSRSKRMDPYYLLMRLPNEEEEDFILLQPFVPASDNDSRKEMASFLVAKGDPDKYGELESFTMPRNNRPEGPQLASANMQSDPAVSRERTLLDQGGSKVKLGNLIVLPIENSLLYVQPFYVEAQGTNVPLLKRVIVKYGDKVEIRGTYREALAAIFGNAPETQEGQSSSSGSSGAAPATPQGSTSDRANALLDQAQQAFSAGDTALAERNLAEYQKQYARGTRLVQQASDLLKQGSTSATTTTTRPAPST